MNDFFKICPGCGTVWKTRADLLKDPRLRICGYQPDFLDPRRGVFLFTHAVAGCETTFAIPASAFFDLVPRPLLSAPRLFGTAHCQGHCRNPRDLEPCEVLCECAYVRDVLQFLRGTRPVSSGA